MAMDFGFMPEDQAAVVRTSLEQLCTISGALAKDNKGKAISVHPASSEVDADGWKHLQAITVGGTSDGLLTAVYGVERLKTTGFLPNFRYQWKDRPHTSRTIQKSVFRNMLDNSTLNALFVTGEESFCKKVKYSRRFRSIWIRQQHGDYQSFPGVLEHLSFPQTAWILKLIPARCSSTKWGQSLIRASKLRPIRLPAMQATQSFAHASYMLYTDQKVSRS